MFGAVGTDKPPFARSGVVGDNIDMASRPQIFDFLMSPP